MRARATSTGAARAAAPTARAYIERKRRRVSSTACGGSSSTLLCSMRPSGGRARSSPALAAKLREAEDELACLEAQASTPPAADIERLIPRLAEEIEKAVRELPKTLAAGNVDLAPRAEGPRGLDPSCRKAYGNAALQLDRLRRGGPEESRRGDGKY